MKQTLSEFIQHTGLSGASIARSLGVSTGTVSLVKNGKTENLSTEILQKFEDFIHNYQNKEDKPVDELVQTSDLKMVQFTVEETMVNNEMGVVYGKAGTGKTSAIKAYCAAHPEAVLVETIPMMTVKSLLLKILEGQGIKNAQGNVETLLDEVVKHFSKSERVLIIDEAENLTTKSLESIRRIHDFSQVPTVLVGTYSLIGNLKGRQGELLQLYSRVSNKWEMQGLNADDRKALFGDLGKIIARFTSDIRRSVSIYKKAKRYSQMASEALGVKHIQMATQSVILD